MNWNLRNGGGEFSIHSLFGTRGLDCTVGLVFGCISSNVTELNCTLEIQGVDGSGEWGGGGHGCKFKSYQGFILQLRPNQLCVHLLCTLS